MFDASKHDRLGRFKQMGESVGVVGAQVITRHCSHQGMDGVVPPGDSVSLKILLGIEAEPSCTGHRS